MTTYTLTVRAADGIREMSFSRDELHMVLNALEMTAVEDDETIAHGDLIEAFTKICYDWTDWEDIEPDETERAVLIGSSE